jgi:hypothetical protein
MYRLWTPETLRQREHELRTAVERRRRLVERDEGRDGRHGSPPRNPEPRG